jgi:hypothetical protein
MPSYRSGTVHQVVLITSTIWGSWLGMQALHELGHVLGAWVTGGVVSRVVLDPRTFSRTDLAANPHPLAAVCLGFWMWHRQGKHFGLGPDAAPVSPKAAWGTCAVALLWTLFAAWRFPG